MNRRRKYYIHPSVQTKYILMSILPVLMVGIWSVLVVNNLSSLQQELWMKTVKMPSLERMPENVKVYLNNLYRNYYQYFLMDKWVYQKIKQIFIFDALILIIGFGFLGLIFSHRIAGPLYRMRRYIDMLSKGQEIPPVRVRGYDEFKEIAHSLDNLRISLNNKRRLYEEVVSDIEKKIYQCLKNIEEENLSLSAQILQEIRESLNKLKNT